MTREHSDPSLERRKAAYSAATTPANSLQSTPASTPKYPLASPFDGAASEQGHLRRQDSGKPSRFQRDAPTGETRSPSAPYVPRSTHPASHVPLSFPALHVPRSPPSAPHVGPPSPLPPLHRMYLHLHHMSSAYHHQWLYLPLGYVRTCVKCTLQASF